MLIKTKFIEENFPQTNEKYTHTDRRITQNSKYQRAEEKLHIISKTPLICLFKDFI